jgi:hypothetical protein
MPIKRKILGRFVVRKGVVMDWLWLIFLIIGIGFWQVTIRLDDQKRLLKRLIEVNAAKDNGKSTIQLQREWEVEDREEKSKKRTRTIIAIMVVLLGLIIGVMLFSGISKLNYRF